MCQVLRLVVEIRWWEEDGCGGAEQLSLHTAGGNGKWCGRSGKQSGSFHIKLNTYLPYDPAIPLLGISPKEMKISVHAKTCT